MWVLTGDGLRSEQQLAERQKVSVCFLDQAGHDLDAPSLERLARVFPIGDPEWLAAQRAQHLVELWELAQVEPRRSVFGDVRPWTPSQ